MIPKGEGVIAIALEEVLAKRVIDVLTAKVESWPGRRQCYFHDWLGESEPSGQTPTLREQIVIIELLDLVASILYPGRSGLGELEVMGVDVTGITDDEIRYVVTETVSCIEAGSAFAPELAAERRRRTFAMPER